MIWAVATALAQEPAPIEEIVVEADAVAPRDDVAEQVLEGDVAARIPGVQGDAVKAVQVLGGVARTPTGGDGLAIWGAAPAETRLYIDDVPVPRLFHRGGLRSVLPTPLVERLTVVPGAPGPRYGRGLGGVVQVRTAAPEPSWGGSVAVDPIDAAATLRAPGLQVGGRTGLLPHTLGPWVPESAVLPVPESWDAHARGRVELPNGDTLSLLVLAVDDQVERRLPAVLPDDRFVERSRSGFGRVGARVERFEGDVVTVSSGWVGVDGAGTQLALGDAKVREQTRVTAGGILLSQERTLTDAVTVSLGLDGQVGRTRIDRRGALSLPAREGDRQVLGQGPGDRVGVDTWTVRQAALGSFVGAALRPVPSLTLEPGLRFEPTMLDGDRVLPVRPTEPPVGYTELAIFTDPRLQLSAEPSQRLRIYAAGGRVHQPPDPADLSPVFGSPVLRPSRAWHALAGVVARPLSGLTAEVVGFGTSLRDLAVRPESPTPPTAALLASRGEGRTLGAQGTLRATAGALETFVTYTWMRAERRASGRDPWRLFDRDQTHGLQAALGWTRRRWELGTRLGLASGLPYTPVVDAVFDARGQRFDPLFGPYNAERLPLYVAVAVRAAWMRDTAWGRYRAWVDVQNATNQANPEAVFYTADYGREGLVRGLPILPVIGLEVAR